jgi:hypothetical protein
VRARARVRVRVGLARARDREATRCPLLSDCLGNSPHVGIAQACGGVVRRASGAGLGPSPIGVVTRRGAARHVHQQKEPR